MYFDNCRTLAELKAEYRRLALRHHPDHGGDVATMQAINAEHDRVFERLKAEQNAAADADTTHHTPHTNESAEDFRRVLHVLMKLDGLALELCGSWLWITGRTRENREALKGAGCRWASKKGAWYWRPDAERMGAHRPIDMERIRAKYGSARVNSYGRPGAYAPARRAEEPATA